MTKYLLKARNQISQKGQGLAEVAVFLALVVVVAIVALTPLGQQIRDTFASVTASL